MTSRRVNSTIDTDRPRMILSFSFMARRGLQLTGTRIDLRLICLTLKQLFATPLSTARSRSSGGGEHLVFNKRRWASASGAGFGASGAAGRAPVGGLRSEARLAAAAGNTESDTARLQGLATHCRAVGFVASSPHSALGLQYHRLQLATDTDWVLLIRGVTWRVLLLIAPDSLIAPSARYLRTLQQKEKRLRTGTLGHAFWHWTLNT